MLLYPNIVSVVLIEFGTCFVIKANETDPKSLIIGGYYIANHSVPYHVMLRCNGKFRCGGALVSAEHVVTAAHCLVIKKCNKLTVTAGTIYRKSGGLYIPADGWYIHPEFDYNSHHNDIAVIKVKYIKKKFLFSYFNILFIHSKKMVFQLKYSFMVSESIAPIKLLTQPPRDGELVQVTGFGRIENESDRLSDIMKTYRSKLYDYEHCHQILKNNRVGPKDVCDRPIAGHGVCQVHEMKS